MAAIEKIFKISKILPINQSNYHLLNYEMTNQRTEKSQLDFLISPEIKNDELYYLIEGITSSANIKNILEIGSSSGGGSTEAFVKGIQKNPHKPSLYCMEVSQVRFNQLQQTYAYTDFVKCYNLSSIAVEDFPKKEDVIAFYNNNVTGLNNYPLEEVLRWLEQDIDYIVSSGVSENGIAQIKRENKIDYFDLVLIDGSEFTGKAEFAEIYGAKVIILDDANSFKNYESHQRLLNDDNYVLVCQNLTLRNGYSIFKQKDVELLFLELPINFFTIVLNGIPFIEYHIEVFKQLPFQWHWHIVEGVADLTHDTAWSLRLGGQITDGIHIQGRSKDGTTEYLDELARLYPDNITIYRKPVGEFWDGKREMIQAPLVNIQEECLLWQVDVDELWTVEQIESARQLFVANPDKTSAYYWCWYFVGEKLVVSTRNCYTQNPQQEWLRTWRFKPEYTWAAHEPPVLIEKFPDGSFRDIAKINPFLHEDTEKYNLVFQHYAYVLPEQLQFKETYYGYQAAESQWLKLQQAQRLPLFLQEYLSWVTDRTMVDNPTSLGIVPIAQKDEQNNNWKFLSSLELNQESLRFQQAKVFPLIAIDAVFFQLNTTGIARVWASLLEIWASNGFAKHIVILDRAGTAPKISGLRYRDLPQYDYNQTDRDRQILQQICNEEGIDLFISTYYSTPIHTPSVLMLHDMIPEVVGINLEEPRWREKHISIDHASAYLSVSNNTAKDLVRFFPAISSDLVTVAHCGVDGKFHPASLEEINSFKSKYGIAKSYFILVGANVGYNKNAELFLDAFAQLATKQSLEVVLTSGGFLPRYEFRSYTSGSVVHILNLSDDELRIAYSGAIALVYPSKYEGFGLPVLEALACGCPVITCPNSSIPEVAGNAAIYVEDSDVHAMADALCEVQKPSIRQGLISAGLEQAKKFSWTKMADTVSSALINATLLHLNLRNINWIVFPDWSVDEESLGLEIAQVVKAIATHPNSDRMTLLINHDGVDENEANLLLSSVAMHLVMEEGLEIPDYVEISLLGELTQIQWRSLLPRIRACISIENENKQNQSAIITEDVPIISILDINEVSKYPEISFFDSDYCKIIMVVSGGLEEFIENTIKSIVNCDIDPSSLEIFTPRSVIADLQKLQISYSIGKITVIEDILNEKVLREYNNYYNYGTEGFAKFTLYKWFAIKHLLSQGIKNVIYTDVDIAWINNPIDLLHRINTKYDLAIQTDGLSFFPPMFCTGFMSFANTDFSRKLIDSLIELQISIAEINPAFDDQLVFNDLVDRNVDLVKNIFPLSEILFANGLSAKSMATSDNVLEQIQTIQPTPFIFHANCTIGLENKKKMLQRTGNWFL